MIGGAASSADRLAGLARAAEDELHRLMPFWLALRDTRQGGFAGQADAHGQADWSAAKGAVLQTRILWFFAKAWLQFRDPPLLDAAWQAYRFIAEHLVDPDEGGVVWAVTAGGAPLDTRKHLYAQAFAIYGLAAFYQASAEPGALDLARRLWLTVEHKAADRDGPGYFEAFSADWRLQPNILTGWRGSPKCFNTHLHLLEAYGALWEVWPAPGLQGRTETLITLLIGPMLDPVKDTFRQFFQADGTYIDDGGSFGHDIEASWLIPAIADRLSPSIAAASREAVSGIAQAVLERALQPPDGGVSERLDATGRPDPGRIWWVQAEALVGFLGAFERSGDSRFLDAAEQVWGFIDRSMIDRKGGEWRWQVGLGGGAPPGMPKAHLWKCPYHNGRACLEVMERAKRLSG